MPDAAPPPHASPIVFVVRFALGYVVLAVLYGWVPDAILRDMVFHYGLAVPAARVIDVLAPAAQAHAAANVIVAPAVTLEIVRGCEGAGLFFLLTAAMLALWRGAGPVLRGLAAGLAMVYLLNLARIVALFFVAAHHHAWFQFLHVYVAPVAVIAIVAAFFWWWAADVPPPSRDAAA